MHASTMGRRIPVGDHYDVNLIHSLLSLSLQMACFAASFAMISALCIRRKSSAPKPSSEADKSDDHLDKSPNGSPQATRTMTNGESEEGTENDMPQDKELPLPPSTKQLQATKSCNHLSRITSVRKFDSSLSMKIKRSTSLKSHDLKKKGKVFQKEDSIWTKTIILGEKCKPDDEDDTIIYDNMGNRISAYHKKTYSSSSNFSRANSHIDTNAIPGQDKDTGSVVRKDKELLLQPNEL